MYTNVVKTLFEEFKGRTVAEITLQGGRGGSAAVATLGISFLESDDKHFTDVNLNFRRYHPGRIDFEEIGSEGDCLGNWKSVDGKKTSCCFEQTMYGTQTGYFELLTVSDLPVGKRFAFHDAKADLTSSKEGTCIYDEVRIMMAFIEVTENHKEAPDHFVCFHIPLKREINVNWRAKDTLLVPHFEEMRKGNLFANSKDFELYFTEEDEEDFVEAERETRIPVVS